MIQATIYTQYAEKAKNCHLTIADRAIKGQGSVMLAAWLEPAVAQWVDRKLQEANEQGYCTYGKDSSLGKKGGFEAPWMAVYAAYLY